MRLKYSKYKLGASANSVLVLYLYHTAPGQRTGDYTGLILWQGIHPKVAGCLSEGGGWCG